MNRREFLKYSGATAAALVVGKGMPWLFEDKAYAQVAQATSLNFTITDGLKNMVTHNDINQAQCYFWIYKHAALTPDCPGPHVFVKAGDLVNVSIKNDLDEPHSLFIPNTFNSGPIAPGATFTGSFTPTRAGTYLYYDNLNEPVNRVMGLHGAFIVMPDAPAAGHRFTPYANPTPAVQRLFDDLGSSAWFPGLSWEQGDAATNTPAFRQYIWLAHQASPNLFEEVGRTAPGRGVRRPNNFIRAFTRDPFNLIGNNRIPQYFTISGQSGHFSHNNPYNNPNNRVGEPVLCRWLNAGLWTHSMHLHANHFYVTGINNIPQENILWLDVINLHPMDTIDWLLPYHRPPDVPNERGIGRADAGLPTLTGGTTWPAMEELATIIPENDHVGGIDLGVQLSPMCFPMHDHSEPTQTAQGGNYNLGTIAGMNFTGDRNLPGGVMDFPNQPIVGPPGSNPQAAPSGVFPPTVGPPWFDRH